MSRKTEVPKINLVTVSYTGDTEMFESFLNCMADDYMNSDIVPMFIQCDFSDSVENTCEEAV